ncbi:MAG TPA: hypothetical protein PKK48_03495 [Phycisphaerae bacterium]|nr:hypothetical protein [Phycisphaerae bacterium]
MKFLVELTADVVEASRVPQGTKVLSYGPNSTGGTIIRPGGRGCYPAFWVRDYAMSLETGMITLEEQEHALRLTAATQQEGDWLTISGSCVPHGSIVDHVSLEGKAIFFPGTLDDYENQGGIWGKRPSLDDHFYFIHMAWYLAVAAKKPEILSLEVGGRTILERLALAFAVPPSDSDTCLVRCDENTRGVSFGFVDAIMHTGKLLFCSLLKYRAAEEMAELFKLAGDDTNAARYVSVAASLKRNINKVFPPDAGLPHASTGISAQGDVWGAAFGVYIGAFDGDATKKICMTLRDSYLDGTLTYRGNVRHVRTCDDFNAITAWERCVGESMKNRYQNGAYWGTPVGWVCWAISQVDPAVAVRLAEEYIEELREGDFRQGTDFGSPWECFHPDCGYRQNPVYMTSVSCPLAAFRKLWPYSNSRKSL